MAERKKIIKTFYDIVFSLTKKHYSNIHKIREINEQILHSELDSEHSDNSQAKEREKSESDLQHLKDAVDELLYKNDAGFLKEPLKELL